MGTPIKPDSFWAIDLPANYSVGGINITNDEESLSEQNVDLVIDNDNVSDAYHSQLTLVNNRGETKGIAIPSDTCLYSCFVDDKSILKVKHRIVSCCHSLANWDGLRETKLVTIDIESGNLYVQYWDEEWNSVMQSKIIDLKGDVDNWSNSVNFEISFGSTEKDLLITSDDDGNGKATLCFIWNSDKWEFVDVIPV